MRQYNYLDYNEYYKGQVRKNTKKFDKTWIKRSEAIAVSRHFRNNVSNYKKGICHGVRNGAEVRYFKRMLNIDILGTDISPTAEKVEDTIQWDFHEVKKEWIKNIDFIYSNSFDHSYNPSGCLDSWMSCLTPNGVCYIHWGPDNERTLDYADCFSATRDEYRDLFSKKYKIISEIDAGRKVIFALINSDSHS